MKNKKNIIFILLSELICFTITNISLISYTNSVYSFGMNLIQCFYFLPIFICSFYSFLSKQSNRTILLISTSIFILYSVFLHVGIEQITTFFTSLPGTIHFVVYASKIYYIALPLLGFRILMLKKEATKKAAFLMLLKIILLLFITILLKHFFQLKGVLYSLPLSELIFMFTLLILSKKKCNHYF